MSFEGGGDFRYLYVDGWREGGRDGLDEADIPWRSSPSSLFYHELK